MVPLKTAKTDLIIQYTRHLKVGLIFSISILILAFKFSPSTGKVIQIQDDNQEIINITDIDPTYQKPEVPEPPKAPKLIEADLTNEIEDIELTDVSLVVNANVNKVGPPIGDKPKLDDENIIHIIVEEMPKIIGGYESLYKNLYYTEIAKRAGIEGTVVISIIVDKNGNPNEPEIVKKIGGGLDDVAMNAVKNIRFTPGIQSGKPVKVKMTIPFKFVLK